MSSAMPADWVTHLRADPLPWLLEEEHAAVRARALVELSDDDPRSPAVAAARAIAMQTGPIASILAAQDPAGWWVSEGPGYAKYRGTTWSLIFLDQLGADGADPRIQRACEYVLDHTQTSSGGFGVFGGKRDRPPPPSSAVHCLNGNLLSALIAFGRLEDERVQRSIDWQARAITGEGEFQYYQSGTSGPEFACVANGWRSCAWGGVKGLRALARIPAERREPKVVRALEQGTAFLLGRDPAVADYPAWEDRISSSWFKPGFPSGYVADVLQNLEVLCDLGFARDTRLDHAFDWLLAKQDTNARWKNEYAYHRKMWLDIEKQGQPSKWVTLRACRVVKARFGRIDRAI
jgi:hypothetical protein